MGRPSYENMTVEELEAEKQALIERFDKRIKEKQNEHDKFLTEMRKANESTSLKAANAWCRVTNALIRKYKTMQETDPEEALKQLNRIEGFLVGHEYLTEQELKEAL